LILDHVSRSGLSDILHAFAFWTSVYCFSRTACSCKTGHYQKLLMLNYNMHPPKVRGYSPQSDK